MQEAVRPLRSGVCRRVLMWAAMLAVACPESWSLRRHDNSREGHTRRCHLPLSLS
jgi:hypothetical protein